MRAHGVLRCVLCPGSRNSPLVNTLGELPDFSCRGASDERSAGYLALGWAEQSRSPVAIVVTSGTALLNLHPAVAEAFYRKIPLLIISADRPEAWIGQQDGQTIPQVDALGSLVLCCKSLPEGNDEETQWYRNRLVNETLLALRHRGGGPVHINIPLSEPLFETVELPHLPMPRVIQRTELATMPLSEEEELISLVESYPRRLIILGQLAVPPLLPAELQVRGFVVVAEHLANAAAVPGVICCADAILGPKADPRFAPDLVISLGGEIASKRIKRLLRDNIIQEHWHISQEGALVDTYRCLTRVLEGDAHEFWEMLAAYCKDPKPQSKCAKYHRAWQEAAAEAEARRPQPASLPYGAPRVTGDLLCILNDLPCRHTLHLANSSALRYAQLFALSSRVHVCCNRGTNGIEGSLSSAIGYAAAEALDNPKSPNTLLIGDLSFFYDMNALGLNFLSPQLRIVLLNNGGGGIFCTLPGILDFDAGRPFVLAEHERDARAWTQACRVDYVPVHNLDEWQEAQPLLAEPLRQRALLVEVFCDAPTDAATMRGILQDKAPS